VKAFVCIDMPPKPIIDNEGDWGEVRTAGDLRPFHNSIVYDRLAWDWRGFATVFGTVWKKTLPDESRKYMM
jgi:hypothetical protein